MHIIFTVHQQQQNDAYMMIPWTIFHQHQLEHHQHNIVRSQALRRPELINHSNT